MLLIVEYRLETLIKETAVDWLIAQVLALARQY